MPIPFTIVTDTITSGASTSGGAALGMGWDKILVQVGTMSTSAALQVWTSVDGGTTKFQTFLPQINSSTVAANSFSIASAVGTNGGTILLPVFGMNWVQFVATAVVSGGVAFKVICSN